MNVYACCYRGNLGYACRIRGRRWMFVPEFGQPHRAVHRNLSIADLRFADAWAQTYERDQERPLKRHGFGNWLGRVGAAPRAHTIGGLLCNVA